MSPQQELLATVERAIADIQSRQLSESPRDLSRWCVMIGTQAIKYEMRDDVVLLDDRVDTSRVAEATRFDRRSTAVNIALKTRNGKGERGEAVVVRDAYRRTLIEAQAVRTFLKDAIAKLIINHETP